MIRLTVLVGILALMAAPGFAISVGQLDDFEDGTTQSWANGGVSPNPPTNQTSGGPGGAGDNYLQETSSGGAGAGSRPVVLNRSANWTGDYATAGVDIVELDLRNEGTGNLTIRVALEGTGGRWVTNASHVLPDDNLWDTNVSFSIAPGDLVTAGGADVNATLSNVTEIRIIHNTSPSFISLAVAATIDSDNIEAKSSTSVNDWMLY